MLQHTGVAGRPGIQLSTTRRRQATDLNTQWVAQLESDMAREYPFPFPTELPAPAFS